MGKLFVLHSDGIYLADGVTKYVKPSAGPRVEVLRQYDVRPDPIYQRRINKIVGLNPFGDPLYRIVWGWSQLAWVGGLCDRYTDDGRTWLGQLFGEFLEPKYSYLGGQCERWILEKWIPAEMYGPRELWEDQAREIEGYEEVQALGPYPSRGDYELSTVLSDAKKGGFMQLDSSFIEDLIGLAERSRDIDAAKRRQLREEEAERSEAAFKKDVGEVWDDAAPAFGGRPNSTQSNAPMHNSKKSIADVSPFPAPAPPGLSVA